MNPVINILLADDDPDDHDFFREAINLLNMPTCNVTYVYNGLLAIDYLLKRESYENNRDPAPDLIVLDLNMPILDGFTTLTEIKKRERIKHIPVYILTTSRERQHIQKCLDLGCAGFFSKPPKLQELKEVIRKMLDDADQSRK
jgi:CheY-like chemotaxis protein